MKRAVLIIFLVGFCKVFGSFEFDILGQLTASTSFPIADSTAASSQTANADSVKVKGSTDAIFGVSLQIGNQYAKTNALKGVSVFFDLRFEQETITLGTNLTSPVTNTNEKNMVKITGLNFGAGLTTKFIFGSVNSLVPRDTILGFGLGAKILVNAPNITLTGLPIITPYFEVFVEQRFFISRKFALVCGINLGADVIISSFSPSSLYDLFTAYNVMGFYPSLNIGVSVGVHFGH